MVCTDCGMVVCAHLIDEHAEWRTFEDSTKTDMRRASTLAVGGGIYTRLIVGGGSEAYRTNLTRASYLIDGKEDKQVNNCLPYLHDMASKLNLTQRIIERAAKILVDAIQAEITKGRPKDTLAAAILYVACNTEGFPRTIMEIEQSTNIAKKYIARLSTVIMDALGLQKQCIQPESLVHRIASQLAVPFKTAELAREMCILIVEKEILTSTAPQVVAAASLLLVSSLAGHSVSLAELERVTALQQATIYKMRSILETYLYIIKPPRLKSLLASGGDHKKGDPPARVSTVAVEKTTCTLGKRKADAER